MLMKSFFKQNLSLLTAVIVFSFAPRLSSAEVLFEGYYRILSFKKHVGFLVVRNEIDPVKKEFKHTNYLKLGKNGFDYSESLSAVSDLSFKPISYEYTMLDKGNGIIFDLQFKGKKITGHKVEMSTGKPAKKTNLVGELPEGVFLASSLYYVILKSPSGMKPNVTFNFKAFAEEQGKVLDGKSTITSEKVSIGKTFAYKVKNEYAGSNYENLITEKGEVLSSDSDAGISTELVATTAQATEGLNVDEKILKKLFGNVPKGISNKIFEPTLNPPGQPVLPGKTVESEQTAGTILKSTSEEIINDNDKSSNQDSNNKKTKTGK